MPTVSTDAAIAEMASPGLDTYAEKVGTSFWPVNAYNFTPKINQFQISSAPSPELITTQYWELGFW